jgi:hypothetical protein
MKKLIVILIICVTSLIANNYINFFLEDNGLNKNILTTEEWKYYTQDPNLLEALAYLNNKDRAKIVSKNNTTIRMPNYKKALEYLKKSIDENNPISSFIYLFIVNTYTNKDFIRKNNKYIKKAVNILLNKNLCSGYMYYHLIAKDSLDLENKIKDGINVCKGKNRNLLLMQLKGEK